MGGVVGYLQGVQWSQHAIAGCAWVKAESARGLTFLSTLPRTCFLASAHAAMVCTGDPPEYSAPGFAPLAVSWGWLVSGLLIGIVLTVLVLAWLGMLRREPNIGVLAQLAVPPGPPGFAMPQDRAREDIFRYIAAGGQPAI